MPAFAHIMNNHAHRTVIVKVASKNMIVVIIYNDGISMYFGQIPFGQPVMTEEHMLNAMVSF